MKKVLVAALCLAALASASGRCLVRQTELFSYSKQDSFADVQGAVSALAFDAEGDRLAFAGKDGVIFIRSLSTKQLVSRLEGHTRRVNALAFRRDGRYLASCGDDQTVRLWDLNSNSSRVLAGHRGNVLAVAFSPDGETLASAGEDKQVILWSVSTATNIGSHTEHKKKVTHIFFLKEESVVTVAEDRMIIEWDVKAKRVLRSWQESSPYINSASASPNGEWLTLGTETTAQRKGGVLIDTPGPGGVRRQNEIKIYSLASGGLQKTFDAGSNQLTSLSISADSSYLVAAHQAMTKSSLVIWDIRRGEQVAVIEQPTKDDLTAAAFSPNGQWLVSGNQSGRINVWKTQGVMAATPTLIDLRGAKRMFLTSREPLFSFRQPTQIAVLDLDPLAVDPSLAKIISEQIRARVAGAPNIRLIERQRIEKVLAEQKFQHSGATDSVTAARIGKILNISKVVIGSLARLGKNFNITVQLVDVETAGIEGIRQVACNSCIDEDLTETVAFLQPALTVSQTASLPTQQTGSGIPIISLTYPPEGEQVRQEEINVRGIVSDDMGIESVRVDISGEGGSRGMNVARVEDKSSQVAIRGTSKSYQFDHPVKLAPGSNLITITVRNNAGMTEQIKRMVHRKSEVTAETVSQQAVGQRWAFIVGISNYQDSKIPSLKFAHRDAEDISRFLQSPAGGSYPRQNIVFLKDEMASWERIREELREFAKKPGRDDLVFFYFAGHGTPDPSEPANVYLVAYNTRLDKLAGTALSIREIELALRENLRAQRVVIFADTCYSGALSWGGTRGLRYSADAINNAFNEAVRRSKPGTFVLTSAMGSETSTEGEQWGGGHGVFTWYLLQAMEGKADANGDGRITADEIFRYAYENVTRDTEGRQHPVNLSTEYDPKLPLAIRR